MSLAAAAIFAVMVWWLSTGIILYLNGLPRAHHPALMAVATLLLALALGGIGVTAADTRPSAAYLAFSATIVVWGWQELGFLLGYVTGPRRTPCPPEAQGWRRAGLAVQAILYHELALLLLGAAIVALTWHQPNTVALWTFAALWVMRLSAKLNIFLGVPNLYESFLPEHLRYMASYFRRRPSNPLFASSVIAATLLAFGAWAEASAVYASPFQSAGAGLVASLLSLAVLEHWFLVLPLPSEQLWAWGMRSRKGS
ncbi:MAG: putative photosynthetic complex assembly protein PuhE [Ideonella sp.]|nr:putative photosynthetic complex assembly protein PuhE [Ideonella sp.]